MFVLGVGFILLHSCNCTKLKVGRIVVFQFSITVAASFPSQRVYPVLPVSNAEDSLQKHFMPHLYVKSASLFQNPYGFKS